MLRLIWKKLNKISNGNLYIFLRFLVRLIIVPLGYFLWILEPFIKIRIYRGETTRIGHLAAFFEVLIRTKEVDLLEKKQLNFFIVSNNIANNTLYMMWKRHLTFIESNLLNFIFHLCAPWLTKSRHFGATNIPQGGLPKSKPTLTFNTEENIKGKKLNLKMGINTNEWFVCLHNRSPHFLDKNFSYHNLRDSSFSMLEQSAKYIYQMGGKCLRMSNGANENMKESIKKYVIDYANKYHNDFMDIYLPANCKFFLGGPSGLLSVSHIFNVPVACTNIWPVSLVSIPSNSLFIPKLFWLVEEKRYLSYKEIKSSSLDKYMYAEEFKSKGIIIKENDNDDIKLLTKDMFDTIDNVELPVEEKDTRDRFMKKYFKVNRFKNKNNDYEGLENAGTISWRFLSKHSYLMNE